jgi:hypothetical protein
MEILDLQTKLQDTNTAMAELERAVVRDPTSLSLAANLRSLQKRHLMLEENFVSLANELELDVCKYRLFPESGRPTIAALSHVWSDFQNLFSVVYDALKSGPKIRARVSAETTSETSFGFAYAYSGSVGIVLTLPSQQTLVGATRLEEAIRLVFELAKAEKHEQIVQYVETLGVAPIRAVFSWANDHVQAGMGAEIEWRKDREVRAHLLVQEPELARLTQTIMQSTEETTEEVSYTGLLFAADTARRTFRLRLDDGEVIPGTFGDAIGKEHPVELPRRYRVVLLKRTKVFLSTEKEETTYELRSLRKPSEPEPPDPQSSLLA